MPEVDYDQLAADQERAEEIRDPGSTARRAAARERERLVREARSTTLRQYRELLTLIVRGQTPDPVELTRLGTALGRSEADVASDVEDRAAEIEDEAEVARCDEERADLEQQVAQEDSRIEKARAEQSKSATEYRNLEVEIARQHTKVAKREKAALAEALQRNQAATATIEHATAEIHQLQARLQNVRPGCNHVERLRQQRFRAKHLAAQQESDRAMMVYADAQTADELPPDRLASAVSPKAPEGPPVQQLDRPISLGQLNGEPVEIHVSKLG
jgi:hypothetical protein